MNQEKESSKGDVPSPREHVADTVLTAFERIARIALVVLLLVGAGLFMVLAAARHDIFELDPWVIGIIELAAALAAHIIPILMIVAFIDPIIKTLNRARDTHADENRMERFTDTTRAIVTEGVAPLHVRLSRIESEVSAGSPIVGFESSFMSIDWNSLLAAAQSVELAAFYWSPDWLTENLPAFERALNNGTDISFYISHPFSHSHDLYSAVEPSARVQKKVLQTAGQFMRIGSEHPAQRRLYVAQTSLNYMSVRVKYPDRMLYGFSMYRNSAADVEGRPPFILIDEAACDDALRTFIGEEQRHLSKSIPIPDFDESEYFEWSEDNQRVVVSTALSCPMPCSYCYVESVRVGKPTAIDDGELLGALLAASVWSHRRLVRGARGTVIFLGGLADPLFKKNCEVTTSFLKHLRTFGCENVVHISTRCRVSDPELVNALRADSALIVNFSASTVTTGIEASPPQIEGRFEDARLLLEAGLSVGLYVRPVLPTITLRDTPQLIALAAKSGIRRVVVGGLYVDTRIEANLRKVDVIVPNERTSNQLIMDRENRLQKVQSDEVKQVADEFREAGFDVFESSFDLARSHPRL